MVAWVGGDLPFNPAGHGAAVLRPGDLVQAVEQDQAAAPAQLTLPPATRLLARRAADRGPHDIGQRDRRIGDDRLRPLTQREQHGEAPPARTAAQGRPGAAAGRVGEQGALAAPWLAD